MNLLAVYVCHFVAFVYCLSGRHMQLYEFNVPAREVPSPLRGRDESAVPVGLVGGGDLRPSFP